MDAFSLLLKPTSAGCNLRCKYCFYLPNRHLYSPKGFCRMTDEVLEQIIRSYLATPQPLYQFVWQGGEPTLMGNDFFHKVTDYQRRFGSPGSVISNAVQTNATCISPEMAAHFKDYKFLVGCSIDGPPDIHDRYRRSANGSPSHEKVLKGIRMLQQQGVDINVLAMVTRSNFDQAARILKYFTKKGFIYQQYIPCVEFDDQGKLKDFAITGRQWGRFLIELFNAWFKNGLDKVSIRNFDAVLSKMLTGEDNLCTMGSNCNSYLVVEHNGDIYPCDFFVSKDTRLGNVFHDEWAKIRSSNQYQIFGDQKSKIAAQCRTCRHLDICGGDCPKHRYQFHASQEKISWLCEGWKSFFDTSRKRLEILANTFNRSSSQSAIP